MELLSGYPLFLQQFKALVRKNAILSRRNARSTILQLLSPLFFLSLVIIVNKATSLVSGTDLDKPPLVSPPIPPCEDKFFARPPCYDFVWSGNRSARVRRIVSAIMRNNPGRPIPPERVKSFGTPDQVDDWLLSNPLRCPGALHFAEKSPTVISYGIQTNSTASPKIGKVEDATLKFQVPLIVAAEREIARSLLGDSNFSWVAGFKKFAAPPGDADSNTGFMVSGFLLMAATFGFVFQMSSLVTERELKLRQAMSLMGLYESAYWLSWLAWETLLILITMLITMLSGTMFRFDIFVKNSIAIVFLTFFLFQLNMLAFAFAISTFISKASAASSVGFLIFVVSFMNQLFLSLFMFAPGAKIQYKVIASLFPPSFFSQAVNLLTEATSTPDAPGIAWSQRRACPRSNPECILTIEKILLAYIGTFIFWLMLAIYLDNVIPNSNGVRKPVFYFLNPAYWSGKGDNKTEEGRLLSCFGTIPLPEDVTPDDKDVLEEETTAKRQAAENETDTNAAIQIRGLVKSYPGAMSIGGCSKISMSPPFHAVKGIWLNLPKNQLFCLLGPNGAGKTTTISCLTGMTPVTRGDALIYGCSVRSSIGMSNIRRMIGVCPQFDILWDALTAREHLHLFASIKGLPPHMIDEASEKLLEEVKLTPAAKSRSSSYSGGMKRRLSVAVALIGDPKVVFLDEPTTGMDPLTRRNVWDIIEEAKKGRAIVLTTHSMEEADILSDRIGIMAKGRLRCIGTSLRLKSRFGAGYVANVSYRGDNHDSDDTHINDENVGESGVEHIKQFFKHHLNLDPKEENEKFLTFLIPNEKEGLLMNFFEELEERASEFGISDIQLGLSTLEEVFLRIAKEAELESAAAGGDLMTLVLNSGISVQIPKGARFVGIPRLQSSENPGGIMVEVHWEQDESGALYIFDHSPETPLPPNIQPPATASDAGPLVGFAIDPNQVTNGGYLS